MRRGIRRKAAVGAVVNVDGLRRDGSNNGFGRSVTYADGRNAFAIRPRHAAKMTSHARPSTSARWLSAPAAGLVDSRVARTAVRRPKPPRPPASRTGRRRQAGLRAHQWPTYLPGDERNPTPWCSTAAFAPFGLGVRASRAAHEIPNTMNPRLLHARGFPPASCRATRCSSSGDEEPPDHGARFSATPALSRSMDGRNGRGWSRCSTAIRSAAGGRTLVIETTNFKRWVPTTSTTPTLRSSGRTACKQTAERLRWKSRDVPSYALTIDDPRSSPRRGRRSSRSAKPEWRRTACSSVCQENNRCPGGKCEAAPVSSPES